MQLRPRLQLPVLEQMLPAGPKPAGPTHAVPFDSKSHVSFDAHPHWGATPQVLFVPTRRQEPASTGGAFVSGRVPLSAIAPASASASCTSAVPASTWNTSVGAAASATAPFAGGASSPQA